MESKKKGYNELICWIEMDSHTLTNLWLPKETGCHGWEKGDILRVWDGNVLKIRLWWWLYKCKYNKIHWSKKKIKEHQ